MTRKVTASESRMLERALHLLAYMERSAKGCLDRDAMEFLDEARDILRGLKHSAARGVHHNPPLTILANPPLKRGKSMRGTWQFNVSGKIAKNVHLIRYTHSDDNEDYEHLFESDDTEAIAGTVNGKHVVLLIGSKDIWDDY